MYVSYTPAYVQKFICDISLEPAALGKKTPQKQVYILAMVYIYHEICASDLINTSIGCTYVHVHVYVTVYAKTNHMSAKFILRYGRS